MATAETTASKPRSAAKPRKRATPAAKRAAPAAKRAASTRSTAPTRSTASTRTGASTRTADAGSYAERAVLIPVGAALIARDRVVAGVNETITTCSSTAKTQAQLRKFERRGATARRRLEREVRKARTSVERELRKRRQEGVELADRLQERVQGLV
jgi:hypothetical protein